MSKTLIFHTLQAHTHNFRLSHEDPSQPPLLGLVASLWDDDDAEVSRMTRLVVLDEGTRVTDEAYAFDGISQDDMLSEGKPIHDVLDEFKEMLIPANAMTSYGFEHHRKVIREACKPIDLEMPIVSGWDLMAKSTPILKMPARTSGTYKTPKMTEAYQFFAEKPFLLPRDGSAQDILNYQLDARIAIYLGIRADEAGKLSSAAEPIYPTWE